MRSNRRRFVQTLGVTSAGIAAGSSLLATPEPAVVGELGGDPDNVTIMGQSGGRAKVSVLAAMPAARRALPALS